MPMIVKEEENAEALEALTPSLSTDNIEAALEMVPRNCKLSPPYKKIEQVSAFNVTGQITAFASPDSTFAVTKRLLDAAKKTISIGIYDFTAIYMAAILKDAMARRVKVKLMLDTDNVKGENEIFRDLKRAGANCVSAPSCAGLNRSAHVFRSAHEKYIVIDDETCIVQSGNYSPNSIPMNVQDGKADGHFRTGNRDMGVAVQSKGLAHFLTAILDSDINLELNTPQAQAIPPAAVKPPPMLVEAAPTKQPDQLFPSKTFLLNKPLSVRPILSPDNYMDVIPDVLRAAKKSILIEQQYIHSADAPVADLLKAIADARKNNPSFDVRIVLGKIFSNKDLEKEKQNLDNMAREYKLKIGQNIRYIDTTRLVHCHNKLIIVDGQTVLTSSQNWSRAAVLENREAGLLFVHSGVAGYFTKIFEVDWKTGQKKLPAKIGAAVATPEDLKKGGFVEVAAADYQQL
jgi:phosphatidylserine/phosphatidylglycerophosphate/cardiolipin synthase-like enzyme